MGASIRRHRTICIATLLALLIGATVPAILARVHAADTPRRGGVLLAVIGAEPPSLDPHQEGTFANVQLVAPCYSTLLQFDPQNFSKIIGDVATEWKIAPDGRTYTFKIRPGIRFHDGSTLTATDIKASYDKIISPPPGVGSFRKSSFAAVERVEAPDPSTVVFKLKFASASLLANLASPWNVIFPKKYLDQDPNYFKNIKLPYQDFAVFVIQEWRKLGVEVEHRPLETAAWFADGRGTGNFELIVFPPVEFMDDPDLWLGIYTSGDSRNWGRFSDPGVDDLFARQARTLDPAERKKLVHQIERIVLDNAYYLPGLWWTRNLVHWAKVKNYVAPPNYYSNQKLQDVWLAED